MPLEEEGFSMELGYWSGRNSRKVKQKSFAWGAQGASKQADWLESLAEIQEGEKTQQE